MKKGLVMMFGCWVVLSLILAPVAMAEQRGVTDTEIRIGQYGPQTGPAALWGAVARGSGLLFDMINDEGGIHGRKITYYLRDDGYMPARTKAIVKELVEDKGVFAMASGVGTAPGMAVKKYLDTNKVPWVGPATGSSHWAYPPTKYLFADYPLYIDEASILINYAVKTLGKKRIAIFYQNDDYGKEGVAGAEYALEKLGMKLVASVSVEPLDTDLSSHCMKLKEANPDVVLLWLLPKHGAIILGTAAKMGFSPQWMTTSTLSDTPIMFQITKGLFKGVIFTSFGELPDATTNPLMDKYNAAREKFAPKERWGVFYTAGILFVEPMVEALKRAGRDLTADSFVKAMESIKDFQGIGPKISYGPNQRQGSRASFLGKCGEGGKSEKLSGWMTSDVDLNVVLKKLGR
ncbi:MAG: branched-chain amino acid transport system substrate-binding protein [Thermodesulfobacteriota bacterium]|nr:branched-chain amino acid transport system substrate-binding protein [Thermodesulfobacteriota bacterium]